MIVKDFQWTVQMVVENSSQERRFDFRIQYLYQLLHVQLRVRSIDRILE